MKLFVALFALAAAGRGGGSKNGVLKKSATEIRKNGISVLFNNIDVDKNMVISPLSIMGCMYMLAAGSAGESREQILTTLGFGNIFENGKIKVAQPFKAYKEMIDSLVSQEESGYTLDIANGMFHQTGMEDFSPNSLDPQYVDLMKEQFIRDVSNIQEVDFANENVETTDLINDWISKQTKGKIQKLFKQPLDSATLVVLASTLYFKGSWTQKFDILSKSEENAKNMCWTTSLEGLLNSECEDVTWMSKEENVAHMPFDGPLKATVFELPLKNSKSQSGDVTNKFMMQIWLPDNYITDAAVDEEFRNFITSNIENVRRKMGGKQKATITMPKFSIEYSENIVDGLQSINITEVFDAAKADLSPMLGPDANAFVSKVTHGVKFEVDENGVEGAAVTAAEISSRTFQQPINLQVNKPFYFVVSNRCWVEKGGSGKSCPFGNVPLFVGRVVHPN